MLCLRVVEDDRKVGAIGIFWNAVLGDGANANFVRRRSRRSEASPVFENSSLGDKTVVNFAYAFLLNDSSAIFLDVRQA